MWRENTSGMSVYSKADTFPILIKYQADGARTYKEEVRTAPLNEW
jgi:hypothetical protein